jgi:energy-coupling factor transporter ATP-binding protein EcfA2
VKHITGLVGRDELVEQVAGEIHKGKHVVLTGAVGIGKSAVLEAALALVEPRLSRPGKAGVMVYLTDFQAKAQFVQIARGLLEAGVLRPSALDLAKRYDTQSSEDLDWAELRRHVTRMSIRDLTSAIIPALHAYPGRVLIAVDDMTRLTPTQEAFWLAVFDHAQVVACASERKAGLRKLWWKMKVIEVPALAPEASREIVREYIVRQGVLIEAPDLYVGHVVKQAGGNPQAVADMLDESSKERVVDKRQIREMRHQAGVRYLDFTPVMVVSGALVVGTRYLAIGLGDTALYVMAGIGAALFLSFKYFLLKGGSRPTA